MSTIDPLHPSKVSYIGFLFLELPLYSDPNKFNIVCLDRMICLGLPKICQAAIMEGLLFMTWQGNS